MDKVGIARLQREMQSRSSNELAEVLAEVMGWKVVTNSDQLFWLIARAKDGQPQVIGDMAAEQVAIISIRKLAALLKAAAETVSFAEVLAQSGFKPVEGELKLKARPRLRNSLSIYEPEKSAIG
jgi:hypothetical protein